jgi:2,4-dienoyl-CoA reductase-like NADH-dependent reductase (Old Yellow Enzyme family)
MPELFAPLTLQNIELKNRIAMSPMCMYAATTGGMPPIGITSTTRPGPSVRWAW